jgi:hypothetical protein
MSPAKWRWGGAVIKICAGQMRNGGTVLNEDASQIKLWWWGTWQMGQQKEFAVWQATHAPAKWEQGAWKSMNAQAY